MLNTSTATMSKEEALIYISKLGEGQKVKVVLVSNESRDANKQLLVEKDTWDYGCYKD